MNLKHKSNEEICQLTTMLRSQADVHIFGECEVQYKNDRFSDKKDF